MAGLFFKDPEGIRRTEVITIKFTLLNYWLQAFKKLLESREKRKVKEEKKDDQTLNYLNALLTVCYVLSLIQFSYLALYYLQ